MTSQDTSALLQPKAKIFDTTAMAKTFVAVPRPETTAKGATATTAQVKSVPTKPAVAAQKPKEKYKRKATQTKPLMNELGSNDVIAFDAEFQDVRYPGESWKPQLAWVAVVGPNGKVIYNVFARHEDEDPPGTKRKLPPRKYGVTWNDLKYRNGAVNAREVEKTLKKLFQGRTVVIHAVTQDKLAFQYEKAFEVAKRVVDTQKLFAYLQSDGQPKLALCAKVILGKVVQGGGDGDHSPVEDAQTARELFAFSLE